MRKIHISKDAFFDDRFDESDGIDGDGDNRRLPTILEKVEDLIPQEIEHEDYDRMDDHDRTPPIQDLRLRYLSTVAKKVKPVGSKKMVSKYSLGHFFAKKCVT
ncbi:hypothetical protein O6H91_03G108300 [Diphasiastrum complanatum]|uniref:Uncharacterized protein n=1 Tax=Diphasiastrum complanatum TaxID=34168 RepID=A0ACC2EA58_DIPCM|nr:hypothetical protein O6H91_03G108300 [Diphasiastrum complanatum]